MAKGRLLVVLVLALFSPGPAAGQLLSDVNADELGAEIAARGADIDRTRERLATLEIDESEIAAQLERTRMEALEMDRALAARAGFMYRLGRRGAAFRYLLGAPNASEFLSRYAILKRLVVSSLEARRDAGERLVEAEAELSRVRERLQSATSMLSQLEEAQAALLDEQRRRAGIAFVQP